MTVEGSDDMETVGELYRGSDGRYYTAWQLEQQFEARRWKPCLHETETDRRLVSVGKGMLLFLTPVEAVDLPPWAIVDVHRGERRVIDTRGGLSPAWSQSRADAD